MATFAEGQQIIFKPLTILAVNTDVGIEIQNFGGLGFASVTIASSVMTLKQGAATPGTVDTGVGVAGVLDMTAAAYNTVAKVLATINASANWRARAVGMRLADSTNATLGNLAATQCNLAPIGLLRATTGAVQTTTYTIGLRASAKSLAGPGDGGWINKLTGINGIATCTLGTAAGYNDGDGALSGLYVVVYSINDLLKKQTRIWTSGAQATGVAFAFTQTDWKELPLSSLPGESLLILIQNSGTSATTPTSPILTINGYRELQSGIGRTERFQVSAI